MNPLLAHLKALFTVQLPSRMGRAADTRNDTITHSGRFDAKLALAVHQAVFDDGEEARVGVGGTDADDGGPQVHIFKHRLLEAQEINTPG